MRVRETGRQRVCGSAPYATKRSIARTSSSTATTGNSKTDPNRPGCKQWKREQAQAARRATSRAAGALSTLHAKAVCTLAHSGLPSISRASDQNSAPSYCFKHLNPKCILLYTARRRANMVCMLLASIFTTTPTYTQTHPPPPTHSGPTHTHTHPHTHTHTLLPSTHCTVLRAMPGQ